MSRSRGRPGCHHANCIALCRHPNFPGGLLVDRSVEVQYYLQPLWNILWNTDAPCWKHLLPVPPLLRYDSLSDGSYAVGRRRALHQH